MRKISKNIYFNNVALVFQHGHNNGANRKLNNDEK